MLEWERLRLCDRSFDRPSSLVSVERARTRLEGRWKEEGLKAGTSARSASGAGIPPQRRYFRQPRRPLAIVSLSTILRHMIHEVDGITRYNPSL